MKISCLQEHLRRGLATITRAVPSRSTLPILSNVLLASDGGRLRMAATDLEIGITYWIPAKVEEEGAITLPARLLNDIVNNLPNELIQMVLDKRNNTVKMNCSRFTNHIKGLGAGDFPQIPTVKEPHASLRLDADVLRSTIERVAIAASHDESRQVLTGVLIRVVRSSSGDTRVMFTAADGYRLATRTIALHEDSPLPPDDLQDIIVPARALNELARMITDDEPVVLSVTPSGGHGLFRTANAELVSRIIDGQFPDFERIIPTTYLTRAVVDTQELLKAVRLASLFASNNQQFLKITMEPGDEELGTGRMILNANAVELGENTGIVEGVVHGRGGQIAMNVKFVTDALVSVRSSQVAFEVQESHNPGVFRPFGEDSYIHIIMPMTMR